MMESSAFNLPLKYYESSTRMAFKPIAQSLLLTGRMRKEPASREP